MKNLIYSSLTILLLLQGCGSETNTKTENSNIGGNGEDLNANPTEDNSSTTRGTTETATVDDLETLEEPRFIDLPINPTFSRVSANIVKEEQSNLYWQDNIEAKTTIKKYADAENYCATLTLDGIDSWRLPTYNELLTIVNYERHQPSIYDIFSHTNDKEYWTQTKLASDENLFRWTIDFKNGVVNFQTGAYPSSYSTIHNVRCVSDKFANRRKQERNFSKNGDIVTDNIHHLLWQDSLNTKVDKYSFTDAVSYCDNLSLGQYSSGWRVPTVKELASLVDVRAYDPSIDGNFTNTAYNDAYWTSDSMVLVDSYRWDINFKDGFINYGGTDHASFNQYVRCVRNQ